MSEPDFTSGAASTVGLATVTQVTDPTVDTTWPNGVGPVLTSPDGTEFRLSSEDDGTPTLAADELLVEDTFNRADQSPPGTADSGQVWAVLGSSGVAVVGNQIANTTGFANRRAAVETGVTDRTDTFTWAVAATSSRSLHRVVDGSNHLAVVGTGEVVDVVAGVASAIATLSGGAIVSGDVIDVVLSGASVIVKRNGTTELTGTTGSLTGTKVGVQISSSSARFDNLTSRVTPSWTGLSPEQHDARDHTGLTGLATDAELAAHEADTTSVHGFTNTAALTPQTLDARGASADGTGAISGGIILARTATDVRNARLGAIGPSSEGGIDAGTSGDTSLFRESAGRWKTPQRLWVAGRDTATQHAMMVGDDIGFAPTADEVSLVVGRTGAPALILFGESSTMFGYLRHDNAADRSKLATVGAGLNIQSSSGTLAFFDATPVARAAAYTQTYATATRTHANLTSTAVATTGATNVTPFGFTTAAQANDIVTQLNAARTDITNLKNLVNSLIDDAQAYGLAQ